MLTLGKDDVQVIKNAVQRMDRTNPVIAELQQLQAHMGDRLEKEDFKGFTVHDLAYAIKRCQEIRECSFNGDDYDMSEEDSANRACLHANIPQECSGLLASIMKALWNDSQEWADTILEGE